MFFSGALPIAIQSYTSRNRFNRVTTTAGTMNPFNPFEAISARWRSGPLEFLITAGVPFVLLILIAVIYVMRGARLPTAFYGAAALSAVLGLLYAPTCGCMGVVYSLYAAVVAFLISALVFLPFIVGTLFQSLPRRIRKYFVRKRFQARIKNANKKFNSTTVPYSLDFAMTNKAIPSEEEWAGHTYDMDANYAYKRCTGNPSPMSLRLF